MISDHDVLAIRFHYIFSVSLFAKYSDEQLNQLSQDLDEDNYLFPPQQILLPENQLNELRSVRASPISFLENYPVNFV